jgi:hypothetical protein
MKIYNKSYLRHCNFERLLKCSGHAQYFLGVQKCCSHARSQKQENRRLKKLAREIMERMLEMLLHLPQRAHHFQI